MFLCMYLRAGNASGLHHGPRDNGLQGQILRPQDLEPPGIHCWLAALVLFVAALLSWLDGSRLGFRKQSDLPEKSWKGEVPPVAGSHVGAPSLPPAAMSPETMAPIPVYTAEEVLFQLRNGLHKEAATYKAMYSSLVRGITTDPAAMVLPLDDHIVHRGHAIFDTATLSDGHLYDVDAHLARAFRSAERAKIVPPFSVDEIRRIIIELVAVSGVRTGIVRWYISAGPGGFNLSPSECVESTFYAVVIDEPEEEFCGCKVVTSEVPIKPPRFATIKSTNYLPNAMLLIEAAAADAYSAIWLDEEGYIAEGPNCNVGFVSEEGVLLLPPTDRILAGCTTKRMLELLPGLLADGGAAPLKGWREKRVTPAEARACREMFLIVSGALIKPVVQWDDLLVGDGKVGPAATALFAALEQDRDVGVSRRRVPIQYK